MVSVTTPQLCHPRHNLRHYVNASVWLRANKYLWTMKFEYHINFMCHGTVLRLFSKHLKMSTPFFAGGPYKNSQRAGGGWRVLACQPLLETNIILILKGPRRLDSGSFFLKECDSGLLQIRIIFLPPLRFESGGKYVCIFGLILWAWGIVGWLVPGLHLLCFRHAHHTQLLCHFVQQAREFLCEVFFGSWSALALGEA